MTNDHDNDDVQIDFTTNLVLLMCKEQETNFFAECRHDMRPSV